MANFCSGVKVRLFGGAAGSMSSSVTSSFWARSIKGVELVKVMVSVLPVSPWREERLRQVSHVSLTDRGIADQSGKDALDTLVEVLAAQSRLVILDNCEQVLDGCAALADVVVRNCPSITLLTTSREPLRIGGEAIYRVPSLSLPPEQVDDWTDLAGSGAASLFVERATAWAPGFELDDEDAPLVASICRRLDGMPLALELATARLRSMSLTQLNERLEHRFGLLTGGSRVALPRHQTLQGLVDWSYDCLLYT